MNTNIENKDELVEFGNPNDLASEGGDGGKPPYARKDGPLLTLPAGDAWQTETRAIFGSCNCSAGKQANAHWARAAKYYASTGETEWSPFLSAALTQFERAEGGDHWLLGEKLNLSGNHGSPRLLAALHEKLGALVKKHGWDVTQACAYHLHCAAKCAGLAGIPKHVVKYFSVEIVKIEMVDYMRRGCEPFGQTG